MPSFAAILGAHFTYVFFLIWQRKKICLTLCLTSRYKDMTSRHTGIIKIITEVCHHTFYHLFIKFTTIFLYGDWNTKYREPSQRNDTWSPSLAPSDVSKRVKYSWEEQNNKKFVNKLIIRLICYFAASMHVWTGEYNIL